jgi:hypothetical protein
MSQLENRQRLERGAGDLQTSQRLAGVGQLGEGPEHPVPAQGDTFSQCRERAAQLDKICVRPERLEARLAHRRLRAAPHQCQQFAVFERGKSLIVHDTAATLDSWWLQDRKSGDVVR